jgi:hypothetical protein
MNAPRYLRPVLAVALLLAAPAVAQTKKLIWKNAAGKEIAAVFAGLQDGEVSLRLPNGKLYRTALTDLSWESARQAIALKWTPGGLADLRLEVPEKAGASEAFLKLTKVPPADAAPEGWIRYRCAHFDFDSQTALDPKTVTGMARVFESTRALLEALPWRIEAVPERGLRFRALIYRDLPSYHAGGGPKESLGVFKGRTGEISLPLSGASSSADTLKHEITHQMMQRLLPVIPWWVVEGTAEYVSIMKYRDGSYDCLAVSKKQVIPHLEVRAPYCTDDAFLKALEYRAQTQVEMVLDLMVEAGTGTRRLQRERLSRDVDLLQRRLAALEEQKALFQKMFSLPAGESLLLPAPPSPAPPERETRPVRGERKSASTLVGGRESDPRELYAASTLMVYYLTTLAPDKGERFARYMWGVQQLRDEYDLSLKFFERRATEYGAKLGTLQAGVTAMVRDVERKDAEYAAWFKEAHKHANTCGHFEDAGQGRVRFTHSPDAAHPPPAPPGSLALKVPQIPEPPSPLLTADEVKKRSEALLTTLMEGSQPLDFIARVKDAAVKLGLKPGERTR